MAKLEQTALQQVKTYLEQGQLAPAFDLLKKQAVDSAFQQLISQQLARYSKLKKDLNAGLVAYEDGTRMINQITMALLELLATAEQGSTGEVAATTDLDAAAHKTEIQQQAEKIYNIQHIDKADFS